MKSIEDHILDALRRGHDVAFTRHGDGQISFVAPPAPPIEPPAPTSAAAPRPERTAGWRERVSRLLTRTKP
jgi:hypothetical protein